MLQHARKEKYIAQFDNYDIKHQIIIKVSCFLLIGFIAVACVGQI